ncbi:hypothetical protein [Ancylobacter polymorphus]|uniref:Uncharacterized protein n=1 Tax=Ancylobacter polymorphus TaxID=223390 RepID=A0A9E7A1B4_9HYPH|nr:hypothetical protein [Ancylobacter polymorphus]UOK71305.1 hypothetical protein K9D25_00835 [Ancylobacter polymorphus]
MEIMFGIGVLLLLGVLAYAMNQSKRRRQAKDIELPEEKVDRKSPL